MYKRLYARCIIAYVARASLKHHEASSGAFHDKCVELFRKVRGKFSLSFSFFSKRVCLVEV